MGYAKKTEYVENETIKLPAGDIDGNSIVSSFLSLLLILTKLFPKRSNKLGQIIDGLLKLNLLIAFIQQCNNLRNEYNKWRNRHRKGFVTLIREHYEKHYGADISAIHSAGDINDFLSFNMLFEFIFSTYDVRSVVLYGVKGGVQEVDINLLELKGYLADCKCFGILFTLDGDDVILVSGVDRLHVIGTKFNNVDYLVKLRTNNLRYWSKLVIELDAQEKWGKVCISLKEIQAEFFDSRLLDKLITLVDGALESNTKLGILIRGKHGVSKSSTIQKYLSQCNALKIYTSPTTDKFFNILNFLNNIDEQKVLVIEDIDTVDNQQKTKTTNDLLALLDSHAYNVVILTANGGDIDPSITRSARIDVKIECDLPDSNTRNSIIKKYLTVDCNSDDLGRVIEQTEGLTHADIHSLVKVLNINNSLASKLIDEFKRHLE